MASDSGEEERFDIALASLGLLRLLRPFPASAFTARGPSNRAWACSLLTLAQLAALWATDETLACSEAEEEVIAGNVISLRILIEEMLPVLSHVASLTNPATDTGASAEDGRSSIGGTAGSLTGSLGFERATGSQDSQQGNLPKSSGHNGVCDPWDRNCLLPADSTLHLLMAAGHLIATSVRLAEIPNHYTVLAGGLQYIGSDTWTLADDSSDGIVAALDAVLSLTHALVMKGAWWREAKAHYPLLLVETLHTIAKVVPSSCQRCHLLYWQHTSGCTAERTGLICICSMHRVGCAARVCLAPACRAWRYCCKQQQG
jgi:hypothetical protein